MNEYFQTGSIPAPSSPGTSTTIRAEFASIAAAFDKLPVMSSSPGEFVIINATGTALISAGLKLADVFATVPLDRGGTGATTLSGAQAALGIDLKANANDAVLTGAPTVSTPVPGDNSGRIANTLFVNQLVTALGSMTPSGAAPRMNGVADAGAGIQVSRDDHVHPVDTSRAPTSAATAAGTSFAPAGSIAAVTVQAAIVELDGEKAPLASPIFTGDPRAVTTATSDNDTSIATTAFVQALLAQQPAGVSVSNNVPVMDGTAAAGAGVAASRDDHRHPTDTSRAPTASPTFTGTVSGITKAMVGLTNVLDVAQEPAVTADAVTKFWSGTKTFRDLATDVRAIVLTGLTLATNSAITATDSILVAFGKLQTQISAFLSTANVWTKAQRGAVVALTDAASVAVDLSLSNNFSLLTTSGVGATRALANPSNAVAGQSGIIAVTTDAASRLLTFGTNYKFAGGTAPTLSATSAAVDYYSYYVETATRIFISQIKDVK